MLARNVIGYYVGGYIRERGVKRAKYGRSTARLSSMEAMAAMKSCQHRPLIDASAVIIGADIIAMQDAIPSIFGSSPQWGG